LIERSLSLKSRFPMATQLPVDPLASYFTDHQCI
jgi:hypothetical protein